MKEIIVKTQKQLDKIDVNFEGEIIIICGTIDLPIELTKNYINAEVSLKESAVINMWENTTVNNMWENSIVKEMWRNSTVNNMWGNSTVNYMWENSIVKEMWGNSIVKEMWGNSIVKEMWGNSTVRIYSEDIKINCFGFNYVFLLSNINEKNIVLNDTSYILKFDTFQTKPTFDFFIKNYPTEIINDFVYLYKAVHKTTEGIYYSNYDNNFRYEIGKTLKLECDVNNEDSCSFGLHASTLEFAKFFGNEWNNTAILKVKIPISSIIVSKDCDGKIRCSEMEIIEEVIL